VPPARVAVLDGEHDAVRNVRLLRQQDVAAVDHDAAVGAAFVGKSQHETARRVIPAPGSVDEATSQRGLGYVILSAQGTFDTTRVFAAVFMLALLGIVLYAGLAWAQRRATPWRRTC
jgi:hypothetical protein